MELKSLFIVVATVAWLLFPAFAELGAYARPAICSIGPLSCQISYACADLCQPGNGVPVRDALALLAISAGLFRREVDAPPLQG